MLDCDLKPIEVILVECPFWLASSITQGMVWPDQQFFNQFRKVSEEITAQTVYDITAGNKLLILWTAIYMFESIVKILMGKCALLCVNLTDNYDVNSHMLALEAENKDDGN